MRILLMCLLAFIAFSAAAEVRTTVPDKPDPKTTYVFYLHGRIIENAGPRPNDPRFGVYDYPAILETLASRGDVVISSQREADTDVNAYAGLVVSQVERLLEAGVPQDRIAVVGFSKGGMIARHVSSFLRRPNVKFVLLAACSTSYKQEQLRLTGHVLAIRETSDTLANASCRPPSGQDAPPTSFEEIEISTGKSHGAFYQPLEAWTGPVLDWIHARR